MPYMTAAEAALFRKYKARRALFFRVATDPPFLAWAGFGSIRAQLQNVALGTETFIGTGQIGGLPQLKQFLNGTADRVEFTLTALGAAAEKLQALPVADVRNVPVHVARACFDETWQLATPVKAIAALVADYIAVAYSAQTHEQPPQAVMTLSTHYGDVIAHTKPALTYCTPTHQKRRDPNDTSCDRVFIYQRGYQIHWPQF